MNLHGGRLTYSRPGLMEKPDGTTEPAVIIFRDKFVLSVLTPEDAIRLADQLIDSTESPATNG